MVEGSDMSYPRVDLASIIPPGRQTEVAWRAIKEGVQEIFWPDIDGNKTAAIVVLPHRLQSNFVCKICFKTAVIKEYTVDAIHGHIAITRRCECGGEMHRQHIGPDQDVPVEIEGPKSSVPIIVEEVQALDEYFEIEEPEGPLVDDEEDQ